MSHRPLYAALAAAGAAVAALFSGAAFAQGQTFDSARELRAELDKALPPVIKGDNTELVQSLLKAKIAPPLTQTFRLQEAITQAFGRLPPTFAPDCQRTKTPQGEPAEDECAITRGEPGGGGQFVGLLVSKNLGFGNFSYLKRDPARDLNPGDLKPVQIPDADAYKVARSYLERIGLPGSEMVQLPAGVALPVRTLNIGLGSDAGKRSTIPIAKTVFLPRALEIPPIVDPTNPNRRLTQVPAPGQAMVMVGNDGAILGAKVTNWRELRIDPKMDARSALTREELLDQMSEELWNEGIRTTGIIAILIGLSHVPQNDYGLLLPAVQLHISPVPNTGERPRVPTTTAGVFKEFPLVAMPDDAELRGRSADQGR